MKFLKSLICVLGFSTSLSFATQAQDVALFTQEDGPWKASCFKSGGVEEPYCRIMVLYVFGDTQKSSSFIQFGPAFDRGNAGFVFASYLGFAPESTVDVKIDQNEKFNLRTSQANHTIAPKAMSEQMLAEMKAGKSIMVKFKLSNGFSSALDYPLSGFQKLLPEVEKVMTQKKE